MSVEIDAANMNSMPLGMQYEVALVSEPRF